jgi:surface carbohydrate biosynthesis protein
MKKNLYILMEIASRELDANLILALFSLKKNFNVILGDSSTYSYLLKKNLLIPGIVLTKSVTHGEAKSKLHSLFKSNGFKLTAIDHEHGVLDSLNYKKYFIKSRIEKKELIKFDAFFCWGNYDYKHLRESLPTYKKKFFLTGSNRVDAWKNAEKENFINEKDKKNIAIFSNFALSNNKYGKKKYFNLKKKAGYYLRCPELLAKDKLFLKYQIENIKKFISMVNYLPDRFPNYNFLFKPHPVENKSFWYKKLVKKNNLKIVEPENSTRLIKFCDLVIQTRCTTSVECVINSINHINYVPLSAKHGFGNFVDKFSNNAKNEEQVEMLIESLLKSKKIEYKKKNILNSRVLFKNIEPASKRIALILKQLSNKIENKKLQNIFKIKISLFVFEIYNQLKRSIYNVIFSYKNLNEYKFPNFSKKIIENKIQKLAINYKFKITFKITKLGNRFWLIEN